MKTWLIAALAIGLLGLWLMSPTPANAILFLFQEYTNATRPACGPVDNGFYNPQAYNQIDDPHDDCSIYGFDIFAQDEVLDHSVVTCGEPILALLNKVAPEDFVFDQTLEINEPVTLDTDAISSISLPVAERYSQAWVNVNEPHARLDNPAYDGGLLSDYYAQSGQTLKTVPYTKQIRQKFEFCQILDECQQDRNADLPHIKNGDFSYRCTNPMPYEVYPHDPERTRIVNEADTCDHALTYNTPENLVDAIFSDNQNPDFLQFVDDFHAISPYSKARELLVVCTYKDFSASSAPNAPSWLGDLNSFDCQEVVTPPGLLAYCQSQGIQADATGSDQHNKQRAIEVEPDQVTLGPLDGFNIDYDPTFFDIIAKFLGINRYDQYASRLNAVGTDTCNTMDEEPEPFGDDNQEIDASGALAARSHTIVQNPNEAGDSYPARRIFVIAPPWLEKCADVMASSGDYSYARSYTANLQQSLLDQINYNIPHSANLDDTFHISTEDCNPVLDEDGQPILDDDGKPIEVCGHWEGNYLQNTSGPLLQTDGDRTPGGLALSTSATVHKSRRDPEWAGDRSCGWWWYIRNLPPPPWCKGPTSTDTCAPGEMPPLTPATGTCNLCSNFLSSLIPPAMQQIIESAAQEYNVPASLIVGILYGEGGFEREACYGPYTDEMITEASVCGGEIPNCRNCNVSGAGALGPYQWIPDWMPTQGGRFNLPPWYSGNPCNFSDATYAIAARLSKDYVGSPLWEDTCDGIDLNNGTATAHSSCSDWTIEDAATAARAHRGLCHPEFQQNVLKVFQCSQ